MNENETTSKANARMHRIQKISKNLRLVLQYGIPLWFVGGLGLSALAGHGIKVPLFHNTRQPIGAYPPTHTTMFYVDAILIHEVLLLILFLCWYRIVLKLFGFFEMGALFTAETVHSLQVLGFLYIVNFFLEIVFGFVIPDINFGMTNLFTGFLIVFIGWLIDEARKIREEQELTV